MTDCANSNHRWHHRLRVRGDEETSTWPEPELRIAAALHGGDLVLASGNKCFWQEFKSIVGERRMHFLDAARFDDGGNQIREPIFAALDSARDCDSPPIAIVYLDKRSRNYEWFLCEVSAAFDAISPSVACVVKLRDFPDWPKRLRLADGKIVCEGL